MGARRNIRVIVEGVRIPLIMNMFNTMNNYQSMKITYVQSEFTILRGTLRLAVENVEVCSSIVFFIALLTIDFLPLPGFLDMLPLSSYAAPHKLVNASFGYAVSFFLERLCTLTITEAFSTQNKDSLFNLTKNKPSSTNFQLE